MNVSEWYSHEDAEILTRSLKEKIEILENTGPAPLTLNTLPAYDREKIMQEAKDRYEEEIKERLGKINREVVKSNIDSLVVYVVVIISITIVNLFPDDWKGLAIIPFSFLFYKTHKIMKSFKKSMERIDKETEISPVNTDDSLDSSRST